MNYLKSNVLDLTSCGHKFIPFQIKLTKIFKAKYSIKYLTDCIKVIQVREMNHALTKLQ